MKKYFKNIVLILFSTILVSCNNAKGKEDINEIKEVIDYVLSYDKGYDDNMKKYITEDNFYVANYVEYYSLYLGDLEMKEYKSEIINSEVKDKLITIYMKIDMVAAAKEVHKDEDGHSGSDEAVGEDVPVEIIVKKENNNYVIKSFKEYENLDRAKELNKGFNK